MSVLEVEDLKAWYGDIQVLFDVHFRIEQGELAVMIGANGAGKSTTLGAIVGLIARRSGRVFFEGQDTSGRSVRDNVKRGICLVPEGRRVFPDLSVEHNLEVAQWAGSRRKTDGPVGIKQMYDIFARLGERRKQLAGTLSGGEQQMLAIARALVARPKLLLVDECSMGLSPIAAHEVLIALKRLATDGIAVLAVEQNAEALEYADTAFVLEQGSITRSARGDQILGVRKSAVEAYLGTGKENLDARPRPADG
jgi:branched-chain amino acid transport system ATP-binding protein